MKRKSSTSINESSNAEPESSDIGLEQQRLEEETNLSFFLKAAIDKKSTAIVKLQSELQMLKNDYSNLSKSIVKSELQNRIMSHLTDLEDIYLRQDLRDFSRDLFNFAKYSKIKTSAVLHYADNFFNYASSIVSSIEFDKDDEYFAIAGVTKKIRIFDFKEVVKDFTTFRNSSFIREDHQVSVQC